LVTLPSLAAGDDLSLRLLGSIAIADASEGFDEPSDLSLDPSGRLLWSVSDDTRRIFALGPEGDLDLGRSVSVDAKELEGIAVLGAGERMLAVKEDTSEVLTIEAATGRIVGRRHLLQLPGFEAVRPDFALNDGKGLEGITVNPTTGDVYVIKEGEPRLLI
jgi:uncharacterized protein YjiK